MKKILLTLALGVTTLLSAQTYELIGTNGINMTFTDSLITISHNNNVAFEFQVSEESSRFSDRTRRYFKTSTEEESVQYVLAALDHPRPYLFIKTIDKASKEVSKITYRLTLKPKKDE